MLDHLYEPGYLAGYMNKEAMREVNLGRPRTNTGQNSGTMVRIKDINGNNQMVRPDSPEYNAYKNRQRQAFTNRAIQTNINRNKQTATPKSTAQVTSDQALLKNRQAMAANKAQATQQAVPAMRQPTPAPTRQQITGYNPSTVTPTMHNIQAMQNTEKNVRDQRDALEAPSMFTPAAMKERMRIQEMSSKGMDAPEILKQWDAKGNYLGGEGKDMNLSSFMDKNLQRQNDAAWNARETNLANSYKPKPETDAEWNARETSLSDSIRSKQQVGKKPKPLGGGVNKTLKGNNRGLFDRS